MLPAFTLVLTFILLTSLRLHKKKDRKTNAKLALAEVEDAIELLDPVDLHITDTVPMLKKVHKLLKKSAKWGNK